MMKLLNCLKKKLMDIVHVSLIGQKTQNVSVKSSETKWKKTKKENVIASDMKLFDDYDFSVNLNFSYRELDFYKKNISDKLEEAEKNNREICFCKYCNQYYSREKAYKKD